MSRSAVDVAMVGMALGTTAIAGVGFATPYWALAFVIGGGVAGGTISLVSQRWSADRPSAVAAAVKVSAMLVVAVLLPLACVFWFAAEPLVALIGTSDAAIAYGARYLKLISLSMPFAALNLIASRTLVGAGDAQAPMILRSGGAVVNIFLNALFIFGFGWGVAGAALGTVLATVCVTGAFGWALTAGCLPGVGMLPVKINWRRSAGAGSYRSTARDLTRISMPLVLTNFARSGAQFPLLAIVSLFGSTVVAAFVIALRVRELMNTPGWGFGLASSSLVGQSLGPGREEEAAEYGRDVLRFAVAVYAVAAALVFVLAHPISLLFVNDPAVVPLTASLIRTTCVSVMFWGVMNGALGPLRAGGDTRWPFYGQVVGLFVFALPIAYLGAVTELGITGLHAALVLESLVPAVVTYARFRTGRWRIISRSYRPLPE